MPLTERDRHAAYEALQQAFGDHTDAVIELLRPDHDQLATKNDLAVGLAEIRTEMAGLRAQFNHDITTAFSAQTRTLVIGLVSAVILIALTNALAVIAS